MPTVIAPDDGAGTVAGSRLIHRSLRETPPVAVDGHGIWLVAKDGRRILDASGGAAVSCLGHRHPRVIEALARQASKLAYAHTSFFSSEPAEALAEDLVGHEPGGLAYVYVVSGGSEAVEARTAVVLGLLAGSFLREQVGPERLACAGAVAAGVALIALS